jgi:PAS domain S-box-containing protein
MTERDVDPDEGGEAPCMAHLFNDPAHLTDADFAQLTLGLADGLVVAEGDGTIMFWNDAATRIFGWSVAEAVGESLDLIIPERLRERHWDGYRRVMATGETHYGVTLLEVPAVHREGRPLSIAFTVTLLRHPGSDRPYAIAALLRDDTSRWQERRELRQRLAELAGGVPSGAQPP